MTLIVPDEGEIQMLEYILNVTEPGDPVMYLYSNDATIDEDVVEDDLDTINHTLIEPQYGMTLTAAGWSITHVGGVSTAEYSVVTFSFSTAASVYGYYVTEEPNDGANILWVEEFSGAPFNIPDGGGTIAIHPKITLD